MHAFSEVTDDDIPQVVGLWERSASPARKDHIATYIAAARKPPSASILVGKKNGNVVCGAMVGFVGQRGWINDVCVDKEFQRQGFGTSIVAAAEAWLQQHDAPNIRLKILYTNLSVIGFYDKLGYRFQDKVVLGKHLKPHGDIA